MPLPVGVASQRGAFLSELKLDQQDEEKLKDAGETMLKEAGDILRAETQSPGEKKLEDACKLLRIAHNRATSYQTPIIYSGSVLFLRIADPTS